MDAWWQINVHYSFLPKRKNGKYPTQWLFKNEEQQWLTSIAKKIKIEERKNMLILLPQKCFFAP